MLLVITPYNLHIFVWVTKSFTHESSFQLELYSLHKRASHPQVVVLSVKECEVIKNSPCFPLSFFNPSLAICYIFGPQTIFVFITKII